MTPEGIKQLIADAWKPRVAVVPREPTEAMLIAAREWSHKKYGKPIGSDAACGCWAAMLEAAENESSKP